MTSSTLQDDLNYVASAVRRRDRAAGVPAVYFLWAAIVLVGWSLPDIAPAATGWFWLVAAPAGGLASWWLAARHGEAIGEVDHAFGRRNGLHWLVSGLALFGLFLPVLIGSVAPTADFGRAMLLVIALVYGLAAVHLVRGLAWPAAVMAGGYLVSLFWTPPWAWTALAVLVSLSLVLAGLAARR